MRKVRIVIILVIIILSFFLVNKITQVSKNENVNTNQVGDKVKVSAEVLKTGRVKFKTNYHLDIEGDELLSWIDLELETNVKYNEESNKYELLNPIFIINTIACDEYEREAATIESIKYKNIYSFGVKLNQKFVEEIKVKYAKQLAEDKRVEIIKIIDRNNINIDSKRSLMKSDKEDKKIVLEYKFKEPFSFKGYFLVTFELVSDKEGYFKVD